MSLRVISGKAKGRKLKDVPGDTTRPVTDMVREALFDILAGDVQDSIWWDLFAGTGAIGIEALSRGAAFVLFSDLNRAPIATIQANLQITGFASRLKYAGGCLRPCWKPPPPGYSIIYTLPTAYKEMASNALLALDANPGWLNNEGAW